MKNIFYYFLIFIIFFLFIYSKEKNIFKLVIDPGHGGKDSGAHGYNCYEKNIVLSVSKKIGEQIKKKYSKKVKIIYTRKKDIFLSLKERTDIANKNHADLFISIHCNASHSSTKGTETYILSAYRDIDNFEVTKRENSKIIFNKYNFRKKYIKSRIESPKSIIAFTLIQNTYLLSSIEFAEKVEENFILANRKSRGVKQAGLFVNRKVSMPSVLIEIGFITNYNECSFLNSSYGQKIISTAICKAFFIFKSEYDNKFK